MFAIDASSHHGKVTDARAERIRKHYAAKLRESRLGKMELRVPRTVTCQVLSADTLKAISDSLIEDDKNQKQKNSVDESKETSEGSLARSSSYVNYNCSLVLAGLHACGDLSVAMLRSFLDSDKIKAVISIGCCYNLLSEKATQEASCPCGFPMSEGVKSAGFPLGKSARDLACQSAERWRGMGKVAGLHNFELHAFRAAFQMVLYQYYPDTLTKSPTVGRQGKALRRQQHRRILESNLSYENHGGFSATLSQKVSEDEGSWFPLGYAETQNVEKIGSLCKVDTSKYSYGSHDKYSLFVKFCESGLGRLGLPRSQSIDLNQVWEETNLFIGLIGPYWSIRAALGPILETLLLLDRLLFLQEQDDILEAVMVPIFDPILSPRNMALIARKV